MNKRWWQREWLGGLLAVTLLSLTLRPEPLSGLEGWGYDLASRLATTPAIDDSVVLVATDNAGGSPEETLSLLERLAEASPRAVALYWPMEKIHYPERLTVLGKEAEAELQQQPQSEAAPLLQELAALATTQQRLRDALGSIAHLTVAFLPTSSWQSQWRWSSIDLLAPSSPDISNDFPVDGLFTASRASIAYDTAMNDPTTPLRRVPLLYRQRDGAISATLPLRLFADSQQIDLRAMRYGDEGTLMLGGKSIASDAGGYFYPRWSREDIKRVTLQDLLNGDRSALDALRGRVVLAGPMQPGDNGMVTLPDGRRLSVVEMNALMLSSLMGKASVTVPAYARWVQLGTLLLVLAALTLLFPRLSSGTVLVIGIVMLVALLNTQLLMFLLREEWLPLLTPFAALAVGLFVLLSRRRIFRGVDLLQQRLATVTVSLAQQLRQQGKLDEALFHLQQCPIGAACDELYHLGLDYERKRQFNSAEQVFAHIEREQPAFKDVAERVRINHEASERIVIAGQSGNALGSTLVMDHSALQKPVVGRYQVERELGRGAMGMVYLGHDPKISRTVAIKTVTLAHDFDEQQLVQVRERFFREAESAGRLSHPNIVTIYDVGEEGDLAYIAMDYLEGVSLDHYTRQEELLPVEEVMGIIAQVADALDYAHSKGVVHRDIKPANIIYDSAKRTATVTDFGVAHLADASKTRTGTILGSPYYMVPEQLAGGKVDGRADLFSLGVTFYQLLTGVLPFEADSIATLMYKITHSQQVNVSKLRKGVPRCATRIVNQLLNKDVEKRFQRGQELHKALQRCLS